MELPRDGRTHLLLIHGTSLEAPFADEDDESYLPFDPDLVRRAGLALCLAGHIHMASHVKDVVYPGSPEPLGWGERGRHCVALVDTGYGGAKVELVDVNQKRYETREVDCSGCASSAEIDDRVGASLADSDPESVFLRLRLIGEIDPDSEIDRPRLVAAHRGRYAALLVDDRTEPLLDIDRRAERKGLDGKFVRKLQERLETATSDRERRVVELALQAGLRAVDGRSVILRVD
jgi:exonuclease SbcD